MESSTNISFVYDLKSGRFTSLENDFNIGRINQDEMTLEALYSWVHAEDRDYVKKCCADLMEGKFTGNVEFRLNAGPDVMWLRVTPFLMTSEPSMVFGNAIDITAEVNNSQSIRKYTNKKNAILNMLAHDLRGPLDLANSMAKVLDKKMTDSAGFKMTRAISGILSQSIQIITDLIDREMTETVRTDIVKERMNIVRKLREYLDECRRSEDAANKYFNFSCSSESIYVEVDEAKFMQVVNSLMTNSLKFTAPGGTISLNVEEKKHSVLFSFSDTGIGIPEELHDGIFEKFTRARRKGLNGEPTIGLGLSLVKTIIDWHNGKIWFESKEHEGTTFRFEIPKSLSDSPVA